MKNIIKKRELKRKVAFLMALSMVFSFSDAVSTGASFSNIGIESSKNENGGEETPDNGEEKTPDNGDEETPDNGDEETPDENENNGNNGNDGDAETSETDVDLVSGAGKIDVAIGTALFLNNNINFTVTLTNSQGDTQTRNIDLENFVENKTSFDNLESGIYTLEISASGFVTYTQEINVAQKGYLVKLTAGFCEGLTYSEGGLHPGVLLIGDVDGNGNVDDEDIDILVDAIDGRNVSDDYATDLNHDGETDLVDLMFLTKSYNENKDTQASIEEFVSPAVIKAKVPEGTHAEGDVEKMLKGEDKVTLTPAKEGPISESNPVSLSFDFASSDEVDENGEKKSNVVDGISFSTGSDNPVSEGLIDVTYTEDGQDYTVAVPVKDGVHYLLQESDVYAEVDANGNIQVHLGNQVAVKTVTITIFGMKKNNNLAEISKTQFVNGMESRIPQPEMDIPKDLTADAGSEKFVVSWKPCKNVTSYEVKIQKGNDVETIITEVNSITVSSFKGDDVKNYTTYTVSVQSINGTWKSGYCDSVNVTPKPNKRPDKPDNVKASGIYKGVNVTWANMDDTQSYNVFYKERNSDEEYKKVSGITGTKYTINDLKTITEYEVYVTGSNELGDSPESLHATATTTDLNPAQMPKYNLINRDENGVPGRSHIVSVKRNGGSMVDSKLDADSNDTAWGAVDNDAASYYSKTTWDDGGFNYLNYNDQTGTGNGLVYTFDDFYKMDTISLLVSKGADPFYAKVRYWTEDGKNYVVGASINTMKDSEGRVYYTLKLPNAVTTNKVQIGLGRYWWTSEYNLVTIAETYFYTYDELMDEVMDLYVDNLHTVLKDNVTQKTIDDLREKVNTPDEFGEINPNTAALLRELETAEKILNAESISSPITIHNGITTKDTDRGFSGLNAWQPLGVSVGTGEEVTIYVGNDKKKSGDGTDLRLIATQYHSESGGVTLDGANLKVGANTFTLKKGSAAGFESGGALYIQYQGASNANNTYSVRVTGGSEVPILDLYKVTDEDERMERTVAYVKALDEYVPKMEALHNETHKNSGNKNIDYDYDAKNCILGASDIVLDTMMYSLPAQQILAGAGNGSAEERAETILKSMKSTEDMMYLFYQHKGLNSSAPAELNQIPKGHLNIRYQRMFSGAFMYASGNHIGIEWNETKGMMSSKSVEADKDGKYVSGSYFGWGIAHEIGHCINQGSYAVAEITNNYFAQLAQAQDKNEGMRFDYKNIYSKVTSRAKGSCPNIATQLGMYWQLHLAYDKGLNYKTYSNYTDQLDNLFYARMDTYSRNPGDAPKPDNITLTLGSNSDQNLMRLACAAANKNILEFFERWGKEPDTTTIEYAEQFEKETRAIFYVSDDSRMYSLKGGESVLGTECEVSAIKDVSVNIGSEANKVDLKFTSVDIPENDILGYEVVRCTTSNGDVEEAVVGFATDSEFTDTISTMNNRTVFYKVTLIDKYLNRSASFTTKMVKIKHDGSMDKTNWSISASGLTANKIVDEHAQKEAPCKEIKIDPSKQAIDDNAKTVYAPQVNSDKAEIIINFNQILEATGLKYTAGNEKPIGDYEIYVMEENEWVLAAEGTFNGSGTVYFANDKNEYVSTYDASAVKLVLLNQSGETVSIAELDVLGVTGDDVDFRKVGEEVSAVIGYLSEDFKYGDNEDNFIPKDSLVFTGSYKGNPAYNVVLLYDGDGNIVGGIDEEKKLTAHQIIMADVPDNSNIANVSDGTWIYWIEPGKLEKITIPEKVRVEMYKVNNALTNEGQRMVSDSLFAELPATLPEITLGK